MPIEDKDAWAAGRVTLEAGRVNEDIRALEALFKTAEDTVHSLPDAPEVTELTGLLKRALSLAGSLSHRY